MLLIHAKMTKTNRLRRTDCAKEPCSLLQGTYFSTLHLVFQVAGQKEYYMPGPTSGFFKQGEGGGQGRKISIKIFDNLL